MDIQQDLIEVTITPVHSISPPSAKQPILKLALSQFQYLAQGSYRVVFRTLNKNSGWYGKVLMLPKRQTQQAIDQQLNQHYMRQLASTNLQRFMYHKDAYILTQPFKDLPKIEHFITRAAKKVACDFKHLTNIEIILAEDVFSQKQQYDIVLQVKTKTIVPDLYADFTLCQLAKQLNTSYQQIKQVLSNCDPTEKTKWFKSKIGHNKREYENSFSFYGLKQFVNKNFQFKPITKKSTKFNSKKYSDDNLVDIFCEQLRKSKLLNIIHSILVQVNEPRQIALFPDIQLIPQKLPVQLPRILQNINYTQVNFKEYYKQLQNESCIRKYNNINKINKQQIQKWKWQNLYKYLIFMCISDMSIVGKIKLSNNYDQIVSVQKSQFKILDFQLIPLKSVKRRHTKNQSVLTRWLNYKQIGCDFERLSQNQTVFIKYQKQIASLNKTTKSLKISPKLQLEQSDISKIMQTFFHLQYIDLCLNRQANLWLKQLFKIDLTNLRYLNLDSTGLNNQSLHQLALCNIPKLQVLKLNYNKIGDSGMEIIKQSNWPQLKHIQFNWNQLSSEGIKYLKYWKYLVRISLVQDHIKDEGIKQLCWQNSVVQHLNLWENKLTIIGIEMLTKHKFCSLKKLILGGNHIDDQGFAIICRASWPSLNYLDLCVNDIKLQFCQNTQQIVKTFKLNQLSVLKLGTNSIKSAGVRNLTTITQLCEQLQMLDLYFNEIGDEGMLNLCNTNWPKLKTLELCMCEFSDNSISALQVTRFPQLRQLLLVRNNLTINGLKAIFKGNWVNLQRIDLMGDRINKKQLQLLQKHEYLSKNKKIVVRID